jgi:hypothetical protein
LIHLQFAISSLPFFARKLVVVLGLFDLIHSSSVREVLNLTWRNSFLLFLSFDCFLDCYVFFYSKFSKIFLKLFDAVDHVSRVENQLTIQHVLINLYFSINKVLLKLDFGCSSLSVLSPILLAGSHPVVHKLSVLH